MYMYTHGYILKDPPHSTGKAGPRDVHLGLPTKGTLSNKNLLLVPTSPVQIHLQKNKVQSSPTFLELL